MARYRVCPVCSADHFKRVTVRLPSGRDRVTDFETCSRCSTVYFQPETSPFAPGSTQPDCRRHVSAEIVAAIVKALPDPALPTTEDELAEYYQHPVHGKMALKFKRMRKVDNGPFFWHFDDAKLLA